MCLNHFVKTQLVQVKQFKFSFRKKAGVSKSLVNSIIHLIDENKPADVVTVHQLLRSQGLDEDCGGLEYLNGLAQSTPTIANASQYARIVRDQSVLRNLLYASEQIAEMALTPGSRNTGLILDDAEAKIFRISENRDRSTTGLVNFDTFKNFFIFWLIKVG